MNIFNDTPKMRKICNIIVAFLFTFSIFTFSVMYTDRDKKDTFADSTYRDAVESANKYNSLITKPSIDDVESSIFDSGIDAFLFAWNNYLNAKSFTITGFVESLAQPSVAGDYIVHSSMRAAKWEDGYTFQELNQYQKQGSKTLIDMDGGKQSYSNDKERYERKSTSGIGLNDDGTVSANYTSQFKRVSDKDYTPVTPICYIINYETINVCTYFKTSRLSNGKIKNYEVELILNPTTSVKGYDETIKKGGNLDRTPVFSSVVISAILDKEGNFETVRVHEKYTLKKTISVPTTNDSVFYISGINQPPTIERLF